MIFVPGELTTNSSGDHSRLAAVFCFFLLARLSHSRRSFRRHEINLCQFAPALMHLHFRALYGAAIRWPPFCLSRFTLSVPLRRRRTFFIVQR
jgi:hypothetical protein